MKTHDSEVDHDCEFLGLDSMPGVFSCPDCDRILVDNKEYVTIEEFEAVDQQRANLETSMVYNEAMDQHYKEDLEIMTLKEAKDQIAYRMKLNWDQVKKHHSVDGMETTMGEVAVLWTILSPRIL
jgi:hypothetical protein